MRYLLDSDTLIAAKNLHYRPDFCQGFWQWVEDGHLADKIYSIDIVYRELIAGDADDHLHAWSKHIDQNQPNFFLPTKGCLPQWAKLTTWATSKNYKQGAIEKFLNPNAADAWLVAYALQNTEPFTIVTNETPSPSSLKSIKLPDAAHAFNIPVMNLYDLLSKHGPGNFNFHP